jgi:nicotinic acid mononucleotide adenylyltransferase
MHDKIARDIFYSELYEKDGEAEIIEAGFFEDACPYDYNIAETLDLMCTPLAHLKENMWKNNPAIILSTGSFNPVHDGHIEMMLKARGAVEDAGYSCVAGYIAPDHDSYINSKLRVGALPIHKRIRLIQQRIAGYEWLNVDPWAGVFHVTSVNFTDIIHRLDMYIQHHLGVRVPIFFVCGGDNARFALTFKYKGNCVVVSRPQYDERVDMVRETMRNAPNSAGVLFAQNDNGSSSTQLRESFVYPPTRERLVLRRDTEGAASIEELITRRFKHVEATTVEAQRTGVTAMAHRFETISLDPFIQGDYQLGISRLFDYFGIRKLGYTNRPGMDLVERQLADIPGGKYCLLDDDVDTGGTMAHVIGLLTECGAQVVETQVFTGSSDNTEVLDVRDFIYGSKEGGLVVNGVRVPYIYPFVCPYTRASIEDPYTFSMVMWEANASYHKRRGNVKLADECMFYYKLLERYEKSY